MKRPAFQAPLSLALALILATFTPLLSLHAAEAPAPDNGDKIEKGDKTENADRAERREREDYSDPDISAILNSVGYPELQVVPRASERLRMEAKDERYLWFLEHWPVEVSGLATFYVGLSSTKNRKPNLNNDDSQNASAASALAMTVGAGWLIGGLIVGGLRPYTSGVNLISKAKGKDERSELFRERMSEEALERPAKIVRNLEWIAVASDLAFSAANVAYVTNNGKVIAAGGIVLAFLPLLFEDHTLEVYDKQMEYKRKIYAPIKTAYFQYESANHSLTPMTGLLWNF